MTWTYDLDEGVVGHVIFRPYLQQSCGVLSYYSYDCVDDQGFDCQCNDTPYASDPNSCGATPITIDNGLADGVSLFMFPLI